MYRPLARALVRGLGRSLQRPGVAGGPPALSISGSPGAATLGTAYSFTPTTTGGSGSYTYSKTSGPAWASVNAATGEVTGTPNLSGTQAIEIEVDDGLTTDSLSTNIVVALSMTGLMNVYGENAGWLDASVATARMYQSVNAVKTESVTAGACGLVLSRNGSLGAELVTNGTYAADTDWTKGTGWAIGSGVATHTAGSNGTLTQALVPGTGLFSHAVTQSGRSSSSAIPRFTGGSGTTSGPQVNTNTTWNIWMFPIFADHTTFGFATTAGTYNGSLDDVTLKRLSGTQFYTVTAGARPLWNSAGYLIYDGTDDYLYVTGTGSASTAFFATAAIRPGGAGTRRPIFSELFEDVGPSFLGWEVEIDTSNNLKLTVGDGSGTVVTVTGDSVSDASTQLITAYYDGTNISVQVGNGTPVTAAFSALATSGATVSIGESSWDGANANIARLHQAVYVLDSALDASTRQDVKDHIATLAGI